MNIFYLSPNHEIKNIHKKINYSKKSQTKCLTEISNLIITKITKLSSCFIFTKF